MNTSSRPLRPARRPWRVVTLSLALAAPVLAQEAPQSEAYRASMAQGDVKRDAEAIQAELAALREQMKQLLPGEVGAVDRAIEKLRSLSQEEMSGAIAALQEASRSTDPKDQGEKIAQALKGQGVVSTDLKRLSVDLQARETLESLAKELSDLVRREVSSSLELARLGRIQQAPGDLRNRDGERYQVANEDQKGITADIELLGRKIELLARDFAADPHNGLVQAAAVAIAEKLSDQAVQASALSASGPLDRAVEAQIGVIRTLVAMQQALASGTEPLDRLNALASRLDQAAVAQKEVMDAVFLIGERQDLDRNFKLMQASLGDEIGAVRYELEPLNGGASGQLAAAGGSVDKALLNYRRMWEEHMDARVNTQEAHQTILLALQAVKDQIAKAETHRPENPAALVAALDQLQREVALAAMQQAQIARQPQPNPAHQQAMLAAAGNFQQRALPVSPEAAALLGQAAANLANPAALSQNDAAVNLAAAARELARQRAEVAALARAETQLAQAEQAIERAEQNLENGNTPQAANALAAAQQAAQQAQQAAQQTAPEAAQQAAQANQNLAQAAQQAAQRNAEGAQAQADAAQQALGQAQAALAQAMAQTPGMSQMAQALGAGNQVTANDPNQRGKNPQSQANGSGGPSGDNLAGAGDQGGPVETLEGLSPQDRDAVVQLQKEQPPRAYVPEVQQYYKNLADGAGL